MCREVIVVIMVDGIVVNTTAVMGSARSSL